MNLARDYDVPEDYWLGAIAIVNAMALRAGNYTIYALHIGILGILSDRNAPRVHGSVDQFLLDMESDAMKNYFPWLVVLLLLATMLTSCTGESRSVLVTADAVTADALATEFPFEPTLAWTDCSLEQGAINLFEHEGRRPMDSSPGSFGGRKLGALKGCTSVKVLDRRWSVYDQIYYYFVEGNGQRGWVEEPLLSFEESQHFRLTPSSSE